MRTALLVPRRDDHGWRDKLWAAARSRWEAQLPDLAIVEGHHDDGGPFNRAAALNAAARLADESGGPWDLGIVIDSDVFIDRGQVLAAIELAESSGKVTWAFRRWRGLSEEATERMLRPDPPWDAETFGPGGWQAWNADREVDLDVVVEKTNPLSWSCCFVVPRPVWEAMGGFDERFVGWGYEDMAFQAVVQGVYGHERLEGDVYHLWHPRSSERQMEAGQYRRPYLENAVLGRLYMIAHRRLQLEAAKAAGDADGVGRWTRDIANLERDIRRACQRLGVSPPTERPSLEELIAGAKAGGANPYISARPAKAAARPRHATASAVPEWAPTARPDDVSIVCHTDGRREYVERSIESFEGQLRAGAIAIERRVFYDDSGDAAYRAWLVERFGRFGWYAVGPSARVGYTGSMQAMTRYLRRRCPTGYILQLEDDFIYERPVDLARMVAVLRAREDLAQVALLRKPAYDSERARGGILGHSVSAFERTEAAGAKLLEHRLFWTANPNLARREVYQVPWPSGRSSERLFGDAQLKAGRHFAFLGRTASIEHIGRERAGHGY